MDQLLISLLVKLVVAASMASLLARSGKFQAMLLHDERSMPERFLMAAAISGFAATGAVTRAISGAYSATDVCFEASLLAGLTAGYVGGLCTGVLSSLPAMFLQSELLAMPLYAAVGVMGGLVRDLAEDPAEVWSFSPFFDLSVYRLVRYPAGRRRWAYHLLILGTILLAELLRYVGREAFGAGTLFALNPVGLHPASWILVYLTTAFAVGLPIKIWASARNERLLEMKERLLTQARLAALSAQINPHFLFNTLNTVSALIRTNPEQARRVVYKLSNILRRLLRQQQNLAPLREEIEFIEDYLSIEGVRFGDKLKFVIDVEPDVLDTPVPAMLLQPIVENSIKHGLAGKIEGGQIRVAGKKDGKLLQLIIEDDGAGMEEARLARLFHSGIGISNVNERLKVLFGDAYRMSVHSKPGEGTRTEIELPAAVS